MHESFSPSRAAGDLVAQITVLALLLFVVLVWAQEYWRIYRRNRRAVHLRHQRALLASGRRARSVVATLPRVQVRIVRPVTVHDPRPVYLVERTAEADAVGRFV